MVVRIVVFFGCEDWFWGGGSGVSRRNFLKTFDRRLGGKSRFGRYEMVVE